MPQGAPTARPGDRRGPAGARRLARRRGSAAGCSAVVENAVFVGTRHPIPSAAGERRAVRRAQPEHAAPTLGSPVGGARLQRAARRPCGPGAARLTAATACARPPEATPAAGCCWRRRCWSLAVGAVGPSLIVVVYSFLTPGDYAGVKWIFSGEAWLNLFLQQDIFDDTWQWADAHLSIFCAHVPALGRHHAADPGPRLPDRLVHRHPAQAQPQLLAVPGHRAVLVQPAGAHLRHHAADPQRGRGQQPAALARR